MSEQAATTPRRALVLSGGGGRGAYQAGVWDFLDQRGWRPDIVVGTSIGAVNGAAIAGGFTPQELRDLWRTMITENVQILSPDLPVFERVALRVLLKELLTSEPAGSLEPDMAVTFDAHIDRVGWAAGQAVHNFFDRGNLLDNHRWQALLQATLPWKRLNEPDAPRLGAVATDFQSGAPRVFWNREAPGGRAHLCPTGGLDVRHVMASCSIPGIYPSLALIEVDGRPYWDGAVVANTPLGPALDAGATEAVVVLMTPWYEASEDCGTAPEPSQPTLGQTFERVLDWALLASFRSELRAWRRQGLPEPIVVAPQALMPLPRIIDYEPAVHQALFDQGFADAQRAFGGEQVKG
jgi:NTE family protein